MLVPDFFRSLLAFGLFMALFLGPAGLLVWRLDLFRFRSRAPAMRLAIAWAAAEALTPPVLNYAFRLGWQRGFAIAAFCASAVVLFLTVRWIARHPRRRILCWRLALVPLGVFLFCQHAQQDLILGDRLYIHPAIRDGAPHNLLSETLAETGVPPDNPTYQPDRAPKLFYYYFWFQSPALVQDVTGSWLGARHAVFGGNAFVGCSLLALILLWFRLQMRMKPRETKILLGLTFLLIGLSGLDVLPAIRTGNPRNVDTWVLSIDYWNLQGMVMSLPSSVLWVVHHISALVAGMFAVLLLLNSEPAQCWTRALPLAALSIASLGGTSAWVSAGFVAIFLLWFVRLALTGRLRELGLWVVSGLLAITIDLPYLRDLMSAFDRTSPSVVLAVRSMSFTDQIFGIQGSTSLSAQLIHLAFLPLQYLLEMGFFLAALVWWIRRKPRLQVFRDEDFAIVAAIAVFVVGSFFRGAWFNNDLGWRVFLPLQILLLMVGARFWHYIRHEAPGHIAVFLLLTGYVTTVADIAVMRLRAPLADFVQRGGAEGKWSYRRRLAYEEIRRRYGHGPRFQHNPDVDIAVFPMNYGPLRMAVSDRANGAVYGIALDRFAADFEPLASIFENCSTPPAKAGELAVRLGIDYWIVEKSDTVFGCAGSWASRIPPEFQTPELRVLPIRGLGNLD